MKIKDIEKLKMARNIINLLLEGINPVNLDEIINESFLNDPKMIRTFSYLALVLSQDILEEEEKEMLKDNLQNPIESEKRVKASDTIMNDHYKDINSKIKSSKIEVFNKISSSNELKKLALLMEKRNQSV